MPSSGSALNAFNSLRSLRCRQELSMSGPECYQKCRHYTDAKLRAVTKIHLNTFKQQAMAVQLLQYSKS